MSELSIASATITAWDTQARTALSVGAIMRIEHDGRFFWHGVEVEGGQDVRGRLLELVDYFSGKKPITPQGGDH